MLTATGWVRPIAAIGLRNRRRWSEPAGNPKSRGRTPYGVRPQFAAVRVERFPHEPILNFRNGADAAGRQSDVVCQVKYELVQITRHGASAAHATRRKIAYILSLNGLRSSIDMRTTCNPAISAVAFNVSGVK